MKERFDAVLGHELHREIEVVVDIEHEREMKRLAEEDAREKARL